MLFQCLSSLLSQEETDVAPTTDVGRLFQCYVHLMGNEHCRSLRLGRIFLICPRVIWSPDNCIKPVVTAGSFVGVSILYSSIISPRRRL